MQYTEIDMAEILKHWMDMKFMTCLNISPVSYRENWIAFFKIGLPQSEFAPKPTCTHF
jgi:hypothetical protein